MQIGERIAAYRKRRGMSQDALAGLVGMSRSWLSQVNVASTQSTGYRHLLSWPPYSAWM